MSTRPSKNYPPAPAELSGSLLRVRNRTGCRRRPPFSTCRGQAILHRAGVRRLHPPAIRKDQLLRSRARASCAVAAVASRAESAPIVTNVRPSAIFADAAAPSETRKPHAFSYVAAARRRRTPRDSASRSSVSARSCRRWTRAPLLPMWDRAARDRPGRVRQPFWR
jgi:hypothetical protein